MIPSIGRIVHYVLPSGEHRPAIIVRVWDKQPTEKSVVQLQVFVDGTNDARDIPGENSYTSVWRTSVFQDERASAGTWHEPERIDQNANIKALASELCAQIERSGASEELTRASLMASNLSAMLSRL